MISKVFANVGYAWRFVQSQAYFRLGQGCLPRLDGVFMAHPRWMEDVTSWMPFLKAFPKEWVYQFAYNCPPFLVTPFYGLTRPDGTPINFCFGATLLFPEQMLHNGMTVVRMKQMLDLAHHCGAKVAAFGAWLPAMSHNGLDVANYNGLRVTTGHTLTTGHLVETLKYGLQQGGIDPEAVITAFVGLGNIGTAAYRQVLYEERLGRMKLGRIVLIEQAKDDKQTHIRALAGERPNVTVASDLTALRQAEVVIVTSGAKDVIIQPEHVGQERVLIVQDSEPWNIGKETVRALRDRGVRVLLMDVLSQMPESVGIQFNLGGRIGNRGGPIYACAAEGMVRVRLGLRQDAVGLPKPEDVARLVSQAVECRFAPAVNPSYGFGRPHHQAMWHWFRGEAAYPEPPKRATQ